MVGRIYHVGLTVSDLERSIAFYRDVLGLEFQGEIFMEGEETDKMFRRVNCKARVAYLNGSKATVCINVANQCAESTIRQKQSVFLLPSLLRVVVASERAVNPDKWLTNVNALVGCPLVTCGDVILDDLPAPSQSIVLLAKLGVIVWLKELVAVYCVCEEEQIRYCVREAMMES